TCIFDTKRSNDEFRVTLQTTPVPLRGTSPPDLRRGARKTSNLHIIPDSRFRGMTGGMTHANDASDSSTRSLGNL
ncbi:MAG: hypothetical protein L0312_14760, partial [Acidobacteria bacterium]|nr:hypothetical protein [Acidobacteriota bacterium]